MKRVPDQGCKRCPEEKDIALADAGFDTVETHVLEVARYFWQSFALPQTQSWLTALECADVRFRGRNGGEIGLETLAAVQAMWTTRTSGFRFNNPACSDCAQRVSEHERQFMSVFQAVRHNRLGSAKTHAMILCEGNATDRFLMRMAALVRPVDPHTSPEVAETSRPQLV